MQNKSEVQWRPTNLAVKFLCVQFLCKLVFVSASFLNTKFLDADLEQGKQTQ